MSGDRNSAVVHAVGGSRFRVKSLSLWEDTPAVLTAYSVLGGPVCRLLVSGRDRRLFLEFSTAYGGYIGKCDFPHKAESVVSLSWLPNYELLIVLRDGLGKIYSASPSLLLDEFRFSYSADAPVFISEYALVFFLNRRFHLYNVKTRTSTPLCFPLPEDFRLGTAAVLAGTCVLAVCSATMRIYRIDQNSCSVVITHSTQPTLSTIKLIKLSPSSHQLAVFVCAESSSTSQSAVIEVYATNLDFRFLYSLPALECPSTLISGNVDLGWIGEEGLLLSLGPTGPVFLGIEDYWTAVSLLGGIGSMAGSMEGMLSEIDGIRVYLKKADGVREVLWVERLLACTERWILDKASGADLPPSSEDEAKAEENIMEMMHAAMFEFPLEARKDGAAGAVAELLQKSVKRRWELLENLGRTGKKVEEILRTSRVLIELNTRQDVALSWRQIRAAGWPRLLEQLGNGRGLHVLGRRIAQVLQIDDSLIREHYGLSIIRVNTHLADQEVLGILRKLKGVDFSKLAVEAMTRDRSRLGIEILDQLEHQSEKKWRVLLKFNLLQEALDIAAKLGSADKIFATLLATGQSSLATAALGMVGAEEGKKRLVMGLVREKFVNSRDFESVAKLGGSGPHDHLLLALHKPAEERAEWMRGIGGEAHSSLVSRLGVSLIKEQQILDKKRGTRLVGLSLVKTVSELCRTGGACVDDAARMAREFNFAERAFLCAAVRGFADGGQWDALVNFLTAAAAEGDCWEHAANLAASKKQIPTALRCIGKIDDLKVRAKCFRDVGREEEAVRAELAAEAASQAGRGLLGGLKSFWSSRYPLWCSWTMFVRCSSLDKRKLPLCSR